MFCATFNTEQNKAQRVRENNFHSNELLLCCQKFQSFCMCPAQWSFHKDIKVMRFLLGQVYCQTDQIVVWWTIEILFSKRFKTVLKISTHAKWRNLNLNCLLSISQKWDVGQIASHSESMEVVVTKSIELWNN